MTSNYLHTKGEEFKAGYFAAMNEKHGDADFVVRTPEGSYEAFTDFGAAIKSMKPVSRLFAPFADGPVSSATQTPAVTTKEKETKSADSAVQQKGEATEKALPDNQLLSMHAKIQSNMEAARHTPEYLEEERDL